MAAVSVRESHRGRQTSRPAEVASPSQPSQENGEEDGERVWQGCGTVSSQINSRWELTYLCIISLPPNIASSYMEPTYSVAYYIAKYSFSCNTIRCAIQR